MMFSLSQEIIHQIMFALEDQNTTYVLELHSGRLEDITSFQDDEIPAGYVELPQWEPANGFRMMERFVAVVRNTALQRQLRSVLFSGKGVFKNFKNLLKSHPQGEKQWFAFREEEMTRYITQWYNQLREVYGLEQLGEEPEDNEDLLQDDFILREYDAAKDEEKRILAINSFMSEQEVQWPGELGLVLSSLWQEKKAKGEQHHILSLMAETIGGDFAGCIEATLYPSYVKETVLLTSFFVLEQYRGLGIGKKLLEQGVLQLQEKGIRWIILADLVIPVFLQTCLTRVGFVSSGGGYILDTKGKIIATEDFNDAGANESLPDFFIGEKDA
ncbi:MAG: GNAT family N-acetyltransferase [Treponema sp.]|nr:GNAT family N-acetyltransferase [Treponema sp.]